ncbi:MAG: MlaD family protein [Octadecabacter sp.]
METRANYLLIGAFTLAGMAGLVGLFVWFAQVQLDQQFSYFDVRFSSVSGLSEASDVRFAGLPVGQVVDVRLSPDRDGTVLVRIEVDAETPVRGDSIATIESQGVTGVSYVGISAGEPNTELLVPSSDTPIPQITAGRSVIQSLTEEAPQLIEEALEVVEGVNALFGDGNQQRIENILQNAEDASDTLAATIEAFAAVPATFEDFTRQVEDFNTILANLSPEVEALLSTADNTVGSLGDLSEDARTMIVTANDTLAIAQSTLNQAQSFINENLTDTTYALELTITDLRSEIATISQSAQDMFTSFEDTGVAATARLNEAEGTLTQATDTLAELSEAANTIETAAAQFDALLANEGAALLADIRVAVADATVTIETIGAAAQTDLPAIIADVRSAAQIATDTISQVGSDLTAASGRVDELSLIAETTLSQVTKTFIDANVTLDAITTAMETGDRTMIVAERAFEGADRVINEDISGIIDGLETSLASLNGAIAQVSDDIPAITADLRAAGQSAESAFASLTRTINQSGPAVSEFATTALPLYTRLADETRGLIDNLDRLTTQIQRDPARFFLDQQSPEFRR